MLLLRLVRRLEKRLRSSIPRLVTSCENSSLQRESRPCSSKSLQPSQTFPLLVTPAKPSAFPGSVMILLFSEISLCNILRRTFSNRSEILLLPLAGQNGEYRTFRGRRDSSIYSEQSAESEVDHENRAGFSIPETRSRNPNAQETSKDDIPEEHIILLKDITSNAEHNLLTTRPLQPSRSLKPSMRHN